MLVDSFKNYTINIKMNTLLGHVRFIITSYCNCDFEFAGCCSWLIGIEKVAPLIFHAIKKFSRKSQWLIAGSYYCQTNNFQSQPQPQETCDCQTNNNIEIYRDDTLPVSIFGQSRHEYKRAKSMFAAINTINKTSAKILQKIHQRIRHSLTWSLKGYG